MEFFAPEIISKNQARTPEGYLLCLNSVIARTGQMIYGPHEVDVTPGPDGTVRVWRSPEEVFHPKTMASFEGKDITIGHPPTDVVPANWKQFSVGHMQNIRRGAGIEDHLLMADLVIKDPDAIALVLADSEYELSCGYDAKYRSEEAGYADQHSIMGNHCALVTNGRCGPACSTKDELPLFHKAPCLECGDDGVTTSKSSCTIPSVANRNETHSQVAPFFKTKDSTMAKHSFKDWLKKARDMFEARDEAGLKGVLEEGEHVSHMTGDEGEESDRHTHIHIHGAPETTKPAGGLPETGETRVSSAADDASRAGAGPEMFGQRHFFTDEALHAAFKKVGDDMEAMKSEMKDSLKEAIKDAMGPMLKASMFEQKAVTDEEKAAEAKKAEDEATKKIEGELELENPAPKATGDEAWIGELFVQTKSGAEILAPGIAIPTFDAALGKADTYKSICALRRSAIGKWMSTKDGAAIATQIHGKLPELDKMECRDVTPLFRGAVAAQSKVNAADVVVQQLSNGTAAAIAARFTDGSDRGATSVAPAVGKRPSLAEMNKMHEEFARKHMGLK